MQAVRSLQEKAQNAHSRVSGSPRHTWNCPVQQKHISTFYMLWKKQVGNFLLFSDQAQKHPQ